MDGVDLSWSKQLFEDRCADEQASQSQTCLSTRIGKESEMPDFDEAGRQDMQKVAVNELDGIECHHLLLITVGRIAPAKTYAAILTAE